MLSTKFATTSYYIVYTNTAILCKAVNEKLWVKVGQVLFKDATP